MADINGWVTIKNMSGKNFENARIKLMAGDVHRSSPAESPMLVKRAMLIADAVSNEPVQEKSFDDFHLYTLPRPTNLRDQETKQLEFTRISGLQTQRTYLYDPTPGWRFMGRTIADENWGVLKDPTKINSNLEFTNLENTPLPAGTIRVYRKDGEQLEFVGEDRIDHTPNKEKVSIRLGSAFDLVGEHKRLSFKYDEPKHSLDEGFEIRLRNQTKAPVDIKVLQHLARSKNWTIPAKSHEFKQLDSDTIQFTVSVPAQRETVITYTAHYGW
jgi:hypothetical protein